MKVSPAQSVKLESYIRQLESQGISRVSIIQMGRKSDLFIKCMYVGEDVHSDHDGLPDILGSSLHCDPGQLHGRLEGSQEIHGP